MKAIQSSLGGLVLAVHHSGKDATKGMRGHSSLFAALDASIEVVRENDRREWRVAKSKDGNDCNAHSFRLDVVEIGMDDDGEPITSCVVAPEEKTGKAVHRILPPKSANQRIAWEYLQKAMKASPHYGEAGASLEQQCVRLEEAIKCTRERMICEEKRKTERAQAAIQGLIGRGLLAFQEGWLWIA